jgi:hypothetical protein
MPRTLPKEFDSKKRPSASAINLKNVLLVYTNDFFLGLFNSIRSVAKK